MSILTFYLFILSTRCCRGFFNTIVVSPDGDWTFAEVPVSHNAGLAICLLERISSGLTVSGGNGSSKSEDTKFSGDFVPAIRSLPIESFHTRTRWGYRIGVLHILVVGRRPAFLLLKGDAASCCRGDESRLSTDNCTSPFSP